MHYSTLLKLPFQLQLLVTLFFFITGLGYLDRCMSLAKFRSASTLRIDIEALVANKLQLVTSYKSLVRFSTILSAGLNHCAIRGVDGFCTFHRTLQRSTVARIYQASFSCWHARLRVISVFIRLGLFCPSIRPMQRFSTSRTGLITLPNDETWVNRVPIASRCASRGDQHCRWVS